jgi:hypothetical protein
MATCCVNYRLSPTFGTLDDGSLKELWESAQFELWRDGRHNDIYVKDVQGLECSGPVMMRKI